MSGARDARSRALTLRVASLLLEYPDERLMAELPLLRAAVATLPKLLASRLSRFLDHLETTPATERAAAYVDTFDLRRRCCLYLSYYTHGDTRKRGMALLRFTHAYRQAGFELTGDELPDHLAVVCEFAATGDPSSGERLLREHRAGLELLRLALAEAESAYLDVVDAIRDVLPDPAPRDLERAASLATTGPPAEEVGLEPFAPPEYMGARR